MAVGGRLLHVKMLHSGHLRRLFSCIACNKGIDFQKTTFSSYRNYLHGAKVFEEIHTSTSPRRNPLICQPNTARWCYTFTQGPFTQDKQPTADDPFSLVKSDFTNFYDDINKALFAISSELNELATYHFDGKGKSFRPMVVMLMGKACNNHVKGSAPPDSEIVKHQRQVAMISEMIHTASLIHDDVIDASTTRRGKSSVQSKWGHKKAVLCADYVLSISSIMLARIGDEEVVEVLSQVLEDLVRGEFMQLGSRENENERFAHYLKKTFKKTASLIANGCKAVAILSECSEDTVSVAYEYGRNIGIAFQLVDDLLDFISSDAMMGKPTTADLKLGLATAPVLFAAQEHPELNALIMRRFTKPGDVEKARKLVDKSDGIKQTKFLAEQHCNQAVRVLQKLNPSSEREALVILTNKVLNRLK